MEGLGNTGHSECQFLQWFFTLCNGDCSAVIPAALARLETLRQCNIKEGKIEMN